MKYLDDLVMKLPGPQRRLAAHGLSLLLGIALAILLDYVLYRCGLPSKPFIYVAF